MGQKFSELIKTGEAIEDGLKSGKVTSFTALQVANKSSPSMATGFARKKKDDVSAVSFSPRPRPQRYFGSGSAIGNSNRFPTSNMYPPSPQAPIPIYYAQQNYQAPPPIYQNQPPTYQNILPNHQANANNLPRPNLEKKPPRVFTPLAETRTQLFERLRAAVLIQPVDSRTINPTTKFFGADQRCAYHFGGAGHDTEERINLKHKNQDLIDNRFITLQAPAPNVNLNPLPNHGGATINMIERDEYWFANGTIGEANVYSLIPTLASLTIKARPEFVVITAPHQAFALAKERSNEKPKEKFVVQAATAQGMTRSGRCYVPEELAQETRRKENQKRPITEGEAEEFWQRMQPKEYSIVKHLEKTPAQIYVWALLMSYEYHRKPLLKVLDEAYVPTRTSGENLATMVSHVIRSHQISFQEEELPIEGVMHNHALYITVKCRDRFVARVLIDNVSGLNICPLSTLTQLNYDVGKNFQSRMNVREFDGSQRETMGKVYLCIQMGPTEFITVFQVMGISTRYNLLLGRPWIHAVGAVPSTLHQLLKFI
ncbi:uncharacterized protein LOC125825188 [Solanum verrucosum]|uniref:uncharacterized protein LOC125825188 n=1 Tax=Solanum verrucosum TaxID=315347 RepID=UPI0020D136A3|nr:uncharacterized protein LOC125825188 [Solanum verrucosum]